MIRAYEEIVDVLAQRTTPEAVGSFELSPAARQRFADLIAKEKGAGLTSDETGEIKHFVEIEHLMRLTEARSRLHRVT